MKYTTLTNCVILAVAVLPASAARADTDSDCKAISQRYEEVNKLTGSGLPHHAWSSDVKQNDGAWERAEIWNDDKGPAKVVVARGNQGFRQELEFYLTDGVIVFVFLRHEVFAEFSTDEKTKLEEERRYFKDGKCIRVLSRRGTFAGGKKPDLAHVPNEPRDPGKEPDDFPELTRVVKTLLERLPRDLSIKELLDGKPKP